MPLKKLWQSKIRYHRRKYHNPFPYAVNMHKSIQRTRARRAALLFTTAYICAATATKSRTAAYQPRSDTYYNVRRLYTQSTEVLTDARDREPLVFDTTDSFNLTVDNCASASVTNDLKDYVNPPHKSRTRIVGINGVSTATMVGTVRWHIEDDDGIVHAIVLPNTYYARDAPYRLLSPQHWSQVADDNTPAKHGTWCATYADAIVLEWNQRKYRRTIPLSAHTNVGLLRTAPGNTKFCALTTTIERTEPPLPAPMYIPAYEDEIEPSTGPSLNPSEVPVITPPSSPFRGASNPPTVEHQREPSEEPTNEPPGEPTAELTTPTLREGPVTIEFNLNGPKGLITADEEPPSFDTLEQEWKWWHDKLKHAPASRMRNMINLGILPKRLKKLLKPPPCAGCWIWRSTRKPWRVKAQQSTIIEATYCGECVSVDQLDATTPGFIAQLKGILTKKRYRYATVFVDHFSNIDYVVPQTSLTSEETVQAKRSFETWAETHGVKIKHYHADNGLSR